MVLEIILKIKIRIFQRFFRIIIILKMSVEKNKSPILANIKMPKMSLADLPHGVVHVVRLVEEEEKVPRHVK